MFLCFISLTSKFTELLPKGVDVFFLTIKSYFTGYPSPFLPPRLFYRNPLIDTVLLEKGSQFSMKRVFFENLRVFPLSLNIQLFCQLFLHVLRIFKRNYFTLLACQDVLRPLKLLYMMALNACVKL